MTRLAGVLLAATLSCAPAPPPHPVNAMTDSAPFALALETGPGPSLRAVLRNVSPRPQVVLVAPDLQPVALEVRDAAGEAARATDERARRKFDRTAYRDLFETLAPGDSLELQSGRATRAEDGTWTLRFGPWRFAGLAPGRHALRATWTSARDGWTDRESGRRGTAQGIWKGTLEAPPATLELP